MQRIGPLLAAIVYLLISGPPVSAESITIGYLPIATQPEAVSESLGLFKKYGIDAHLQLFRNGPAALQALMSGDIQVVDGGAVPMLNMAAQGLPVYFLSSSGINTPEFPGGDIMIRKDETAIKSFADLKGRRVGQLAKGVNTYFWLWNATNKFGMERASFQEIFVPFPQMGALLASNQVDAVYTWHPYDTIIEQEGLGKKLTDDSTWNPYSQAGALVVKRDWADKNPDTVGKLVKISIETNRWIDDHPDEGREVIGKNMGLAESVYGAMARFYFPRNGYQLMPSIWDTYYLMVKSGEFQPLADPQSIINDYWIKPAERFIRPAVQELGVQDDPVVTRALSIRLENLPEPPEKYLPSFERNASGAVP
jgi:ABC-type nitrate/sulfonate/bicarbonate transport system substrate-binding protein